MIFSRAIAPGISERKAIHSRFNRNPDPPLPFYILVGAEKMVLGLGRLNSTVEHHVDVAMTWVVSLEKCGIYTEIFQ